MNKLAYYLSMSTLVLVLGFLLYVIYYIFVPVEVIKANVQPYKIINKNVIAGGLLVYEVDSCKLIEGQATVTRRFVSDVVYTLPAEVNNAPKGCNKTRVSIFIPQTLPAGIWHLQIDVEYTVNTIRTKSYHFATEEFKVATQEGTVKNK